jgi:hypothetical protein
MSLGCIGELELNFCILADLFSCYHGPTFRERDAVWCPRVICAETSIRERERPVLGGTWFTRRGDQLELSCSALRSPDGESCVSRDVLG